MCILPRYQHVVRGSSYIVTDSGVFLLLIVQFLDAAGSASGDQARNGWVSTPIVAILSIILIRQILQQAVSVISVMEYMARNRLRLMPLFFPSIRYLLTTRKADAFLDPLLPDVRDRWLTECLTDITDEEVGLTHCRCRDAVTNGVIYLDLLDRSG